MRNILRNKWSAAAIALTLCNAALADRDDHHHEDFRWHGDIHEFHVHDYPHWREGRWYHGHHGDQLGWWWVVGGLWYFYPGPVYPYPDPYTPPVVIIQQPTNEPTAVEQMPSNSPPPAQNWYYCNSSKNYYPYVSTCPEGWKTVPATPPGVPNQ